MQATKTKLTSIYLIFLTSLFFSVKSNALPIGFGRTESGMTYHELRTKNFSLYFDKRTSQEARLILESLEAAKPHLESWFGKQRSTNLPVILSSSSLNPSFANFVTDALELQTYGLGDRDLAFHELTHNIMYLHLLNIFGPAGSAFHLPFMPAWFLEGLAESLSMSMGSSYIAGVERYQALSGDWPTYAKIHSLYKSDFSSRGYATSAGLLHYIIETYGKDSVENIMTEFYLATSPLNWPALLIPHLVDLPMDVALKKVTGKPGSELYNDYKRFAKKFWTDASSQDVFFTKDALTKYSATSLSSLSGASDDFTVNFGSYGENYRSVIKEKDQKLQSEKLFDLPRNANKYVFNKTYIVYTETFEDNDFKMRSRVISRHRQSEEEALLLERYGTITKIYNTGKRFAWMELLPGKKQFCYIDKSELKKSLTVIAQKVQCPFSGAYPENLNLIGTEDVIIAGTPNNPHYVTSDFWFTKTKEDLYGTSQKIFTWNASSKQSHPAKQLDNFKVTDFAKVGNDYYILTEERSHRTVRRIGINGSCFGLIKTADHILAIEGTKKGSLALRLFAGNNETLKIIDNPKSIEKPCSKASYHSSALLASIKAEAPLDLKKALTQSSYRKSQREVALEAGSTNYKTETPQISEEKTASPNFRPVFFMPWIGSDAYGTSLGLLSVPLMDHMQREDVRLTALYGLTSDFPDTYATINSSRFKYPTALSLFRRQVFNGTLVNRDTLIAQVSYMDEAGAQFEVRIPLPEQNLNVSLIHKYSHLKPWSGQHARIRRGNLHESTAAASFFNSIGRDSFGLSLSLLTAPGSYNENFDYYKVATSARWGHSFDFLSSRLTLETSASGTRGEKTRELKEYYSPLKTYIPGAGGGFNQNSFSLSGDGSLTAGRYGDTKGRVQASFTFPLVKDGNRLINIFYLERIDFTSFVNHGGAWYGQANPPIKNLETAHGHNIDAQLDLKGIGINFGLGVGQVLKYEYEMYLKFGFDAIL